MKFDLARIIVLVAICTIFWCCPSAIAQQNTNGVIPLHQIDQPYLFLIRDPVVHKDLGLTADQIKQLAAVNDQMDLSIWSRRNKSPEQQIKITNAATTTTRKELASILTEEQIGRINQIELWVLGMKSLARDDVAATLKLDAQQRSSIRDILQTTYNGMADLQKKLNDGGDADELNRQFRELQLTQQTDIIDQLSTQQKQAWAAALGKRIDLAKLGRIRFRVPELQTGLAWVNSEPLTMEKLKGKVVALHFYAFA